MPFRIAPWLLALSLAAPASGQGDVDAERRRFQDLSDRIAALSEGMTAADVLEAVPLAPRERVDDPARVLILTWSFRLTIGPEGRRAFDRGEAVPDLEPIPEGGEPLVIAVLFDGEGLAIGKSLHLESAEPELRPFDVNDFLVSNPDYRARAGEFYEHSYLPGAVRALAGAVEDPRLDETSAREALVALIYEFLDAYIAGGGGMTAAAHRRVVERLDSRIRDRVGDGEAFRRYEAWRDRAGREANPLDFLLNTTFDLRGG